ncbi:Alpha/beta hydrolase fold-3 [Dillenia turbinata]|uniref:Alpha/beta hydrolase fold-3 n=1 Tax=Dillenia turbinata TaxID=194707 RepID=A0AAN8W194_9MAGN
MNRVEHVQSRGKGEENEIAYEMLPLLRVYKDGRVERLIGTDYVPPTLDPSSPVLSKDVSINSNVSARLFLPNNFVLSQKLPLLVHFHGGGFCCNAPSTHHYHRHVSTLSAEAKAVAISVHYRRPPEHPLPAAYEDSWAVLQWVQAHKNSNGPEPWLNNWADFSRVFLAGDSAGANIAHNMGMKNGVSEPGLGIDILGIALVHPYFWGSVPIGSEANNEMKATVDRLWPFVCPLRPDKDDPWINPVGEGAPSLVGLGCRRVLVCAAENDVLRDRAWLYYETLSRSGWMGVVEIMETEGVGHVFHLHDQECEKAVELVTRLAAFFNRDMT